MNKISGCFKQCPFGLLSLQRPWQFIATEAVHRVGMFFTVMDNNKCGTKGLHEYTRQNLLKTLNTITTNDINNTNDITPSLASRLSQQYIDTPANKRCRLCHLQNKVTMSSNCVAMPSARFTTVLVDQRNRKDLADSLDKNQETKGCFNDSNSTSRSSFPKVVPFVGVCLEIRNKNQDQDCDAQLVCFESNHQAPQY